MEKKIETKYYIIKMEGTDIYGSCLEVGWIYFSQYPITDNIVILEDEFTDFGTYEVDLQYLTEITKEDYKFIEYCNNNQVPVNPTEFVINKYK